MADFLQTLLRRCVPWLLAPALCAGALAAPLAAPPVDAAAQGMSSRVLACIACHGKEGRATPEGYFPRIAGKPAGYLYHQLLNFRDGRRSYPQMGYLIEHLTDDYLREMAEHFAALRSYVATTTTNAIGGPDALTRLVIGDPWPPATT